MNLSLRCEQPGDESRISEVTELAFRTAAHTCGREHILVGDLRAAGALTISWVALVEEEIVGHVAVSPVEVEKSESGWFGLGPLSVVPEFQRRGIGGRLMTATLAELRARGARGCILVGDPAFYTRFGFVADGTFTMPGVPAEVVLALRFAPGDDHGLVSFHPAFLAALNGEAGASE